MDDAHCITVRLMTVQVGSSLFTANLAAVDRPLTGPMALAAARLICTIVPLLGMAITEP
jgi:hypothetical protein